MQVAPDNSGLYLDMMQRAVDKIGFQLKVIRPPKKRGYKLLEQGDADLYASGEFRDYRSEFLLYFPNGLYRVEKFYGLTTLDTPEIKSISELKTHNLVWIFELGSSWPEQARAFGVKYLEIKQPDINKAVRYFNSKRAVFFKVEQVKLDKYMKKNKINSMAELGIKVHRFCCKAHSAPLYTGFSRASPYYMEQANPLFDNAKPLGAENFPYILVPGSVPDRLKQALKEMKTSGEIEALKKKYSLE